MLEELVRSITDQCFPELSRSHHIALTTSSDPSTLQTLRQDVHRKLRSPSWILDKQREARKKPYDSERTLRDKEVDDLRREKI